MEGSTSLPKQVLDLGFGRRDSVQGLQRPGREGYDLLDTTLELQTRLIVSLAVIWGFLCTGAVFLSEVW